MKRLRVSITAITLGAIALRFLLLLGRGDYVAFDEGWYLLLGRSLWTGEGYSLVGTPHLTLSPLFPLLAGGVGRLTGDWLWGGRLVAALASGLLVLPVWSLVRRWSGERTALAVAAIVAVTPSLAPFVAAYWVGADLWVGAEPVLHLFLYAGLALWARALDTDRHRWWGLSGLVLAAAFLARPEALGVVGILVLWSAGSALRNRSRARALGTGLLLAAFAVTVSPYWIRLHSLTGTWRLTGREVDAASAFRMNDARSRSAASDIERMLLVDDGSYEARLYSLDPSGLRMQSAYWGVVSTGETAASTAAPPTSADRDAHPGAPNAAARQPDEAPSLTRAVSVAAVTMLPVWAWVIAALGLLVTLRRPRASSECGATVGLLATSGTIALVAAVDARTQLFLVPLLILWMVRGVEWIAHTMESRFGELRPGFVHRVTVAAIVLAGLGTLGWQLTMSRTVGSPHHVVGAQNRAVGEALDSLLGGRAGPVASWHPAIAVFADRAWRPLPLAGLPQSVRYAQASGAIAMIISAYYPPTRGQELFGTRYTIVPVASGVPALVDWGLSRVDGDSLVTRARLIVRPTP
jgi:hypothetical protein